MLWLLMSSSLLILLICPFWIVHWAAWGCLIGFVGSIFLFIVQVRLRFKLAGLVLVSHGVGMVVSPRAVL